MIRRIIFFYFSHSLNMANVIFLMHIITKNSPNYRSDIDGLRDRRLVIAFHVAPINSLPDSLVWTFFLSFLDIL